MRLRYKAVGPDNKTVIGMIDAKDISDAAVYLRNKKLVPIHIVSDANSSLARYLPFLNKTKSSDIVYFTRQLSSMLVSGLTLVQSLALLKEQVQTPAMAEVISNVLADIEEGNSFSTSIVKYPAVFSPVYVSSIKAAEESGLLDKVLLRLADNLEKKEKLKSTIKSALMYPAIVLIGMIAVVVVMMVFVIPQISALYESLNIELPLPTLIVVGMSRFFTTFYIFIFVGLVLGFFLFRKWYGTESGRLIIDDYTLRIPLFGKLMKESILTEFTRTFGLLVGSGTLVVEALRQSAGVSSNVIYQNAILGIARRVEKGVSIGDSMQIYPMFPPILVQMVRIGEETGKVDESLLKVSEYFEREVDTTVKNLTTAMEPLIMIVLGIGVAFLIISIITPIYGLISQIQ